jgi:hypothetical protein
LQEVDEIMLFEPQDWLMLMWYVEGKASCETRFPNESGRELRMLVQLETNNAISRPRELFYSYSHKDESLRDQLDASLTILQAEQFISTWHDRKIPPGTEWKSEISEHLEKAEVILLLVSRNFVDSPYCRDVEVRRAMERHRAKEAIVIPIILSSGDYSREEFASLQWLPANGPPLAEWPEDGFAFVTEQLRIRLFALRLSHDESSGIDGQQGNWLMKLRGLSGEDAAVRAARIVARLRDFSGDYTIRFMAKSATKIADGGESAFGLLLVLQGTREAFLKIDRAHHEGRLSEEIGDDVAAFYSVVGAVVEGSARIKNAADMDSSEAFDHRIGEGKELEPPFLKGVYVPRTESGSLSFVMDKGGAGDGDTGGTSLIQENDPAHDASVGKLLDYFRSALAVKEEHFWVNLSAFEHDRMIPPELAGTQLGRDLLEQDCTLKRRTASLLHPDDPTGRKYWDAVYSEARRRYGTSRIPINSFHKVWILPSKAVVYEHDGLSYDPPHNPLHVGPDQIIGYIVEHLLEPQCEVDYIALQYMEGKSALLSHPGAFIQTTASFATEVFREIVLPRIREEVNKGEHFAKLRQIYSAMILAAWLKRRIHLTKHRGILALADTNKPSAAAITISDIKPFRIGTADTRKESGADADAGCLNEAVRPVKWAVPDAPAFRIPENVEFYQQYMQLFEEGVFRCVRGENGDNPDERLVRSYFSGAIDLSAISPSTGDCPG